MPKETGFPGCEVWLGKGAICKAGQGKGRADSGNGEAAVVGRDFFRADPLCLSDRQRLSGSSGASPWQQCRCVRVTDCLWWVTESGTVSLALWWVTETLDTALGSVSCLLVWPQFGAESTDGASWNGLLCCIINPQSCQEALAQWAAFWSGAAVSSGSQRT